MEDTIDDAWLHAIDTSGDYGVQSLAKEGPSTVTTAFVTGVITTNGIIR